MDWKDYNWPARFHGRVVKGLRLRDGGNRDRDPVLPAGTGGAAILARPDEDRFPLARDLNGSRVYREVLCQVDYEAERTDLRKNDF